MKSEDFLNRTVSNLTGYRAIAGKKFGVELELEGRNVGLNDVATRGWNRHAEPSLRGESIEFTPAGAKTLEETQKLVNELFDKFNKNGAKINKSLRTSTHVHLNFADQPMKTVINFFALFTLLEELIQYYCGEERKGSHFSLSTREGEGIVGVLANSVRMGDFSSFAGDRYKYAACNLSSLYKFGTVEVRSMRGATNAEEVNAWLDILSDLYDFALTMKSPVKLVQDLSAYGAEELLNKIFKPKNVKELLKFFPKIATLHYSLMEGARILQVFAYEFDEAFLAEPKVEPNVKMPKQAKGLNGNERILPNGDLPALIPFGPNRGTEYVIYLPEGSEWSCYTRDDLGNFMNGAHLNDEPNVVWDGPTQRFYYIHPEGGRVTKLNWKRHHAILDEGPPVPLRDLFDGEEIHEEEPDWEPDFDDEEERDF